jgi:hypothetical protein
MATVNALTLSATDIAVALIEAGAGGTVLLPSDSIGYSSPAEFNLPSNITIKNASATAFGGGDLTKFIDNVASGSPMIRFNASSTGIARVSGITLESGTGASKQDGTIVVYGGNIRFDHMHWDFSSSNNFKMAVFGANVFGSLDHCIVDLAGLNAFYFYNGRDNGTGNGQGNYEWTLPAGFGSENFFFIENNVINGDRFSRIVDGFTASRVVLRFNTANQAVIFEQHATGHSGDDRGPRAFEAYCNLCLSNIGSGGEPNFVGFDYQSGSARVWFNDFSNATGTGAPETYKNGHKFQITRTRPMTYDQGRPQSVGGVGEGWGYIGPTPIATGVVNVSGAAVTHVSGDLFNVSWPVDSMIYIVGMTATAFVDQNPDPGPGGSMASVNSTTSITLNNGGHTGSPLTNAAYFVGSPWDGNTNGEGYAALDQPGRGAGGLITGSFSTNNKFVGGVVAYPNQASDPIYIWGNVGGIRSGWGGNYYAPYVSEGLIAANRDYYPQSSGIQTTPSSPFNGTEGTGYGTLANRPPDDDPENPLTPGVGYFVTNEGAWNKTESNAYGVQMNGASGRFYRVNDEAAWVLDHEPHQYPNIYAETTDAGGEEPEAPSYATVTGARAVLGRRR